MGIGYLSNIFLQFKGKKCRFTLINSKISKSARTSTWLCSITSKDRNSNKKTWITLWGYDLKLDETSVKIIFSGSTSLAETILLNKLYQTTNQISALFINRSSMMMMMFDFVIKYSYQNFKTYQHHYINHFDIYF